MTVLGNTSDPTFGFNQSSTYNQICPNSNALTVPGTKIIVTKLWVYIGVFSGSFSGGKLCIWGTGNTLLYASQGALSVGTSRRWRSIVPDTTVLLNGGSTIFVGCWVPTTANLEWGIRSSGGWKGRQDIASASSMSGSSSPGSPYIQGEMGAYLEYEPAGGVGYASGGAYSKYALRRYDTASTTWKWHPLKRYNSSTVAWEWLA